MGSDLPVDKRLLIIGGSGRNVGKTTLILMLLKKYQGIPILGLKVSAHRKEEEMYHGTHIYNPAINYTIFEENCIQPWKDTARMVQGGAQKAFYIEAADHQIIEAYNEFKLHHNPENFPVICESRSLRKHVIPAVNLLLVKTQEKLSAADFEQADHVIYYDKGIAELSHIVDRITLSETGWEYVD